MDYYSVLGIPKTASSDQIKQAYRKLAKANHPDRTGGDDTKFKQINEAYDTLKDPNKKAAYDNPQPRFNTRSMDGGMEDIFSQMFTQRMYRQPPRQKNKDIRLSYTLDFRDIFFGRGISLQYRLPSGQTELLDVRIPPGVKNGDIVNFAGYGDNSIPHLPRGNLILQVKIKNLANWTRDGDNLYTSKSVDVFDLILGTEIEILLPNGKHMKLNIPKGTKPDTTFSMNGHGAPNVNTSRPGNVYIKIKGIVPKIEDTQILEKIRNLKNEIS